MYVPFLRELLHTQPLTGLDPLVVFVLSSLGYAAIRLGRVLFRRKCPADPPGVASGGRPWSQMRAWPARSRYTCRGTLPVMLNTSRITLCPGSAVGSNMHGHPPSMTVMPC